jgi:hypothetical protein
MALVKKAEKDYPNGPVSSHYRADPILRVIDKKVHSIEKVHLTQARVGI